MPTFICKLDGMYFEWSTIVDAPTTYGMTLSAFKRYYRDEYGRSGYADLARRLERVKEIGTSSLMHKSVEDVVAYNRAGPKETSLTLDEIRSLLRAGRSPGKN